MSDSESTFWLDRWRRGAPVRVTIIGYATLAALTVSATTGRWGSPSINLAICLVAALWMLIPVPPALRKRAPLMAVFVAGAITIMAVLVIRDPWFGFYAYLGYSYSILLLPWPWQVPAIASVAFLAATSQASAVDKHAPSGMVAYAAIIALNLAGTCALALMLHVAETQHRQREQAIGELQGANRRLEAALAENEGLHRQLLTQAREAGILDERQRMAREIHDTLAQGLTGIITQLQAAEQAAEHAAEQAAEHAAGQAADHAAGQAEHAAEHAAGQAEHAAEHAAGDLAGWRRHFAAATRLARESLSEARRSVHALRPEPLETGRLSDALAGVAQRWSALHAIPVQVTSTGAERPMPPDGEIALLRAAQEALANVARHAEASRVGLTLSYMDNEVALDIRDDGKGFDPEMNGHPATGGFGLVAMRQRMERLSGTLQVESEPGTGTAISARIPVPAIPGSIPVPTIPVPTQAWS
jgi:signal transduction histidine kinase